MRYEFHPQALAEFEDAVRYYSNQEEGLGTRFVACVDSALEQVLRAPMQWRIFERDVRRYLVPVFPYAVLFSVEAEYILIVAVMHCRRKPGYWRRRIP